VKNKKKILMVASADYSLIAFRGDFIKSLIENGFEVFAAAPHISKECYQQLYDYGANPINFNLQRTGLNPFKDIKSILELRHIINKHKIDLVFPYTVKPVIYSSIAANLSKVSVISLITGLGFTFTGLTRKARLLQRLNEFLYKVSIRKNKMIIFQNSDDYDLFLERNILTVKHNVGIVSGSGVNLNNYKYRENKNSKDVIRFLFVSRLIKEKGIALYLDGAEKLKKVYPKAEFHVIGVVENSPSAIKLERLSNLHDKKVIIYHGPQNNVSEHLFKCDVFVLPTYYREGIPRSILEALSVGLPIITTNTAGCKETVLEKQNGILIEPNNLDELVSAMEFFLSNKSKIKEMGINSRKYAEKRFDVNIINNDLNRYIKDILKL
jgi:glycosyltransferase involved in cell wall biosynthesis